MRSQVQTQLCPASPPTTTSSHYLKRCPFTPLMFPAVRLNHDIWHQIIQYFECGTKDTDTDKTEKRTTLRHLAVTSRLLSGLALAILWKDMSSLHPIVDVINAIPTPEEENPVLIWMGKDNDCGYWVRLSVSSPSIMTSANVET